MVQAATFPRTPRILLAAMAIPSSINAGRLSWTYVYALPNPKIDNKFGYLLKDWQVSGTTTLRDGLAAPLLTFGDESGVGNYHTRFDCVAPIHYQLRNSHSRMRRRVRS